MSSGMEEKDDPGKSTAELQVKKGNTNEICI